MRIIMQPVPSIALSTVAGVLLLAAAAARGAERVEFNRDIRPLLADACFACHGPDPHTREAGLRLDTAEGAQADLGGYRAVVPGDPEGSELLRRIGADDEGLRMPPAESGKSLTAQQIALIRRWIDQGAEYQEHWSLIPPRRPEVPAVSRPEWVRNPIDAFVMARLDAEGLAPSPEADRRTLVRRVSLDLTGLPPTPEEVEAFVNDAAPDAWETLVGRLLDSPRYGEHMARAWLDAARYADTNGYQYDTERTMWPWREWVIEAFNHNVPFDRFTVEQLAGDLLPGATPQQRVATGFNRNHPITIEGGVIDEEYRTEYVIDRIETTATVWMGLTMGCARCHDHKYDPITRRDFYRFFAFFNNVPERGLNGFAPTLKAPAPSQERELRQIAVEAAQIEQALEPHAARLAAAQDEWERDIAARLARQWDVLEPAEMKSTGGSTLTRLDDRSVLAGGATPHVDDYELLFRTGTPGVTAIRLEALTHESLPHKGAGRAFNSNFVLSAFEVEAAPAAQGAKFEQVKLASASADYSQQGYEVGRAIDGNLGTGWAVDGPTRKESSTAVFLTEGPVGFEGGTRLRITLRHRYGTTHAIGRLRISVSNDPSLSVGPERGTGTLDLEATRGLNDNRREPVPFSGPSLRVPAEVAAALAVPSDQRTAEQSRTLREHYLAHHAPDAVRGLAARLQRLRQRKREVEAAFPESLVMAEMDRPRETFMLERGQYDQKGERVSAGVPESLPPLPQEPADRLALARWLVGPEHPLTARVTVNRLWQQVFGTGLVRTAEDFGTQGEWPSHPELLDWLAVEFSRHEAGAGGPEASDPRPSEETAWDVKRMMRLIVTSATYRQSSRVTPELLRRDPANRLLGRGPRFRLQAETLRDNALAVSGLLAEKVGGPSVYPYQPEGLWLDTNNRPGYSRDYPTSTGDDLYRRSIYTFWKRTVPHPAMAAFDAPEREVCSVRRSRTNTPVQALVLLNDPQFVEAARRLAERMMAEGGDTPDGRITRGFLLAVAREPRPEELAEVREFHRKQLAMFRDDEAAARRLLSVGESPRDERLDPVEHATWTSVARLLLNLDETITRN